MICSIVIKGMQSLISTFLGKRADNPKTQPPDSRSCVSVLRPSDAFHEGTIRQDETDMKERVRPLSTIEIALEGVDKRRNSNDIKLVADIIRNWLMENENDVATNISESKNRAVVPLSCDEVYKYLNDANDSSALDWYFIADLQRDLNDSYGQVKVSFHASESEADKSLNIKFYRSI